ncbi:U4 u6 small nuclear ribonucleoprotein [Mycena indigotica]|uniref:U4 u6 small nuclear ribonucleoprotein n=1 Tax=Mycena indigotica TaxID=2126181 RepID=A0A8H6RYA0_9AGAR|nr:U4 u6 small nuclear ribonucleoprotein [Mycena indigotica]KAF7289985.1 U4 u6 small nuclear ribonucleoprotein [Mycena indigotica]
MSEKKRAFDGNGETPANKKLKRFCECSSKVNGSTATPGLSSEALIAEKRAEIAAKLAAMRNQNPSLAVAVAKPSPSPSGGSTTGTPVPSTDAINKRVKRLVEDAHTRMGANDNPYMSLKKKSTSADIPPQGAGLKMAAHPLLLDTTPAAPQSKKDRYKPMQPKFASIKANVRNVPAPPPVAPISVPVVEKNPYAASATSKDTLLFEGAPKERTGRSFRFNAKGKYVALGAQMRQENQLEALKQRIAESARKAGLDGDMGIERGIKRTSPPDAEWWDQPLLPNKNYADLDEYAVEEIPNIRSVDSPITIYVQHPIPIPAPGDKNKVALKPMMLTTKERKKMRKLKRAGDLQDKRDRVAMGLIPPDAPKVRLSNMMKVLTSDAVQDPTKVEARIRREVAMRKHTHEKMNEERKLTDEQRREKIEMKKAEEDKRGIYGAVFKVKVLSDPAHRFKVRKNAEQMNLSGLCIMGPNFSMIYVEGPAKSLKKYKKLMLIRIAWTQAARPRGGDDVVLQDNEADRDESPAAQEVQEPVSLEGNTCWMVWQGMLRERAFHEFRVRHCQTDGDAKELLGDRLRGYWDQAKNWREEDDLL